MHQFNPCFFGSGSMKKGFTILETLMVSLFIPLIMILALGLLMIMINTDIKTLNQNHVFKVQIRQLLSRSVILECHERLLFTRNKKEFEIVLDKNRIVKKPGFEILLFDVEGLYFEESNQSCQLIYSKEGEQKIEIKLQD